jgi:4-aminobutyrate aminotransferase-like enzyme
MTHTTKTDDMLARDARVLGDVLKVRFYPLAIDRAEGCTITDVDGQQYLDFMAGWAVANTGYGTPEILDPVMAQMRKTSFCTLTAIMNEVRCSACSKIRSGLPFPRISIACTHRRTRRGACR